MGTAYKIRCRHCGAQFEHYMQPGYGVLPMCVGCGEYVEALCNDATKVNPGLPQETQHHAGGVQRADRGDLHVGLARKKSARKYGKSVKNFYL